MGSRITSIFAVIISLLILVGAAILFFFGFTDFKPESVQGLVDAKDAKANTSKLPVIDVESFLLKNKEHNFSVKYMNDSEITKGTLYTYPKCFYIKESLNELRNRSDLNSMKPDINIGQSVKFFVKRSPSATETYDFCGHHKVLKRSQYIAVGTGIVAVVILSLVIILTIMIILGCCSDVNIPMVVAIIGVFGFISGVTSLGFLIYFTVNYYTLRGMESKDVALGFGLPEQGNNLFYLFGTICILFSNLVFVLMMFIASKQRKREIIYSAARNLASGVTY